jgi:ribosomal-protein-alanine N-acetyltransferase
MVTMKAAMGIANDLKAAQPWLQGREVFLRHPRPGDQAEFLALNRASAFFHRGLVSPPRTEEQFSYYLARAQRPSNELFFICRRHDSAISGAINLNEIIRGAFQNAFLGYFIGARFASCGYMTEALELVLRHAFRHLKLHRLEANLQPGNESSRSLVRKAGFKLEGFSPRYLKISGRWRDHERWAITIEDWRAMNHHA